MIFPEKPLPPWRSQPKTPAKVSTAQPLKSAPEPLPPGYWRERIELAVIAVGFYFWVVFWIQFK